MEKVIITGASGLTGSHVTEYFAAQGIRPVCLARKKSDAGFRESPDSDLVYGDITDLKSLTRAFEGCGFVIHTAGMVSDWGKYGDFHKANVEGNINVLKAAHHSGIDDLIITGSISCYGEESSEIVKDEEYGYHSHYPYFLDRIFPSAMNYYRDTKAEAGVKAAEYAARNSMNLTIIEPAWIYGEREFHSGFYDFLKTVKNGTPFVPGSKKNKFHTIYARDLAKIYYLAYKKRLSGINRLLAVAPVAENQYELMNKFCREAGLKPPRRLPKFLLYPPGLLLELIWKEMRLR